MLRLVLALALALSSFSALAQEGPAPDRRVVATIGQDFYGGDIGSIFETDFSTCHQTCLGNPECKALTFNTRASACFLKSGIERREAFEDAISAEMVSTPTETLRLALNRRGDIDFVSNSLIASARTMAATLGGRFAANAAEPEDLMRLGAEALQRGAHAAAARNFATAATLTDSPDAWRELARTWGLQEADRTQDRRKLQAEALSAAINAYLRSDGAPQRATSLAVLAEALEDRGYGRLMIDALRLSQSLQPRAETEERLAYAISRYGFRVTGHRVDSDAAIARICIEFSEELAGAGVDYAPYVKVTGDQSLPVEADGMQLCVDGVARGERYSVEVRKGLPSADGEALFASARVEAYIRDRSPTVHFVGRAHVLPRSADAAIPIVTVNATEVRLEIHRIGERNLLPVIQSEMLEEQLNEFRENNIAGRLGAAVWTGSVEVSGAVNADVSTALPIGEAVSTFEPGIYAMTARLPGDTDSWERAATQWFIVTDLGLASMTGADGLHAFVRALSSAAPVAGAEVALVARNNEVLGTGTADAQGYVKFAPGLARGTGGMAPAMLTVETEGDFAFLDLSKPGFDLSDRGVEGRPAPGPVDVFATTERGVYRPGEVVHMTVLARNGQANAIPDLPLTAVITRPDGVEYQRALLNDQGAGGRAHSLRLGGGVPRGTWKLKVHTDPKAAPVTQVSFLVEDFVPERIDFDLDMPEGLVRRDADIDLDLAVRYLYGAPGADLTVAGEVRVTAAEGLPGFPGFSFGVHDEPVNSMSEYLSEVTTDANGDATLRLVLPDTQGLTKPLRMTAIVGVSDSSGRPVERTITRPLAPQGTQIGIRPLFEGQAEEGSNARFEVIAVGPDGTQIPLDRVGWTVSRVNTDWQWYRVDGRWRYEAIKTRERIANGTVSLTADGRMILEAPVEWGAYELRLAALGGETPVMATYGFRAGWYTGGAATDTPDVLEVGLDKERYAVGERVRLRLKPRDAGKVLITVVDNRLIEMRTIDVPAGTTVVDLTVTDAWGPGAYITATLIRPMDVAAKRNPARALGLAWAEVDPGDRALQVEVTTPEEVAPRGPLAASVRLANVAPGEQAYVTIAAVDFGILNLTGFDSPDPKVHYFGQRALGMDMRDLYGKLIDGMQGVRGRLRTGGDAAAARLDAPPPTEELVAYFSGVVTVGADGTATTNFELPDFNGTVRVMAVAWTATAVGGAAKDILVRDPIVVQASVPRFLAPGDRSRVLIEVAHAKGPTGDVGVLLENLDGGVQFDPADAGRRIFLQEGQIERISVPVTAAEIGNPRLRVRTMTPGGQELTKTITLPVRLNDPEVSRRNRISLAAGGRLIVDRNTFAGLEPGTGRASLALGPVAEFDAAGLLVALDRYPYGCTEQTISRALPLLYLDQVAAAMGITRTKPVAERVQAAIDRVLENQSSSGAFGLWRPARGDLWLDAYVTDFLSRARAAGHTVPDTAFQMALDNLISELSYVSDFETGGEDIAYALMVLAREGYASIGDLRYFADARARNFATPMAKAQLGAALAMYGEQVRADKMFRMASDQALARPEDGRGWRADYGSHLRDGAAVIALAAEAGSTAVDFQRLTASVGSRNRDWTSTQEKVWMLLATRALMGRAAEGLAVDGQPVAGPLVRVYEDGLAQPVVIENTSNAPVTAMLTTFGVPTDPGPAGGNGYAITRAYYSLDGEAVSPESVAQNARLVVVVTIQSNIDRRARLMIDDPLPAGFEIDNPNLLQTGSVGALNWLDLTTEVENAQFRSDRFLTAVDYNGRGEIQVAYIVRAVSPGTFHHPAAIVEDMYRPDYRAWTSTGSVSVVAGR